MPFLNCTLLFTPFSHLIGIFNLNSFKKRPESGYLHWNIRVFATSSNFSHERDKDFAVKCVGRGIKTDKEGIKDKAGREEER